MEEKMSKVFREKHGIEGDSYTTVEMREFCKRPGKMDADGFPIYYVEQSQRDQCDINKIIRKYDKTGLITHVRNVEARYGDVTGLEFKTAMDRVIEMQQLFDQMPSHIRKRFSNDPALYLEFMENPENRDEAIKLGLILPETPADKDGLGEHVTEPETVTDNVED